MPCVANNGCKPDNELSKLSASLPFGINFTAHITPVVSTWGARLRNIVKSEIVILLATATNSK